MGKIYRLSQKPSCFEATLELIERSFHYIAPNTFKIDFYPLIDKSNHHNCFILVDDNDNVLAHIGAKERIITLNDKKFPIMMLGGIAVDENHRGEGLFQELFLEVLTEVKDDSTFMLLWSDLEKLYNKYGFYLCGTQFESSLEIEASSYTKTTFQSLSQKEQEDIKNLYEKSFAKIYLTLDRSQDDWEKLGHITSANLFIKKENDSITDYYFMNKGQDLPEVIYEYGTNRDMSAFLKSLSSFGKVWTGKNFIDSECVQFQFFMAPGDLKLFSDFIYEFTNHQFTLRDINNLKQEVYFDFNDETLSLEIGEFLKGVFGPHTFEELELPSLFISGLESV